MSQIAAYGEVHWQIKSPVNLSAGHAVQTFESEVVCISRAKQAK
jgi:hypothetical protein